MDDEYVRVTDEVKPRREYTMRRSLADGIPEVKILDKPALNEDGSVIPPKYAPTKTSGASSASTTATEPADRPADKATDTKEK